MMLVVLLAAIGASPSPPPQVTLYANTNAVFGRAAFKADKGPVRYLGAYQTLSACEAACLGQPDCKSFAWHQADMIDPDPKSFRTLCCKNPARCPRGAFPPIVAIKPCTHPHLLSDYL